VAFNQQLDVKNPYSQGCAKIHFRFSEENLKKGI
jgi:hypothetical protein